VAIRTLALRHPADPFYPILLERREVQKIGGTYIGWWQEGRVQGGLPVGRDGRVHTIFTDNPSTLRWASEAPNMQNIPRGDTPLGKEVRKLFVAPPGKVFWALDFAGIEAVLVGYFAGSKNYTRLAKLDVHSFFTAHVLKEEGILTQADLPDLAWADEKLLDALGQIKAQWKDHRNVNKRLVHGGNYLMGVFKAQEVLFKDLNIRMPIAKVKRIYALYYELFPEIRSWQIQLCRQVDGAEDVVGSLPNVGVSYVRNPFGFVHRFHRVIEWERIGGKWEWRLGQGAPQVVAFLPQSTAAAMGKEVILALPEDIRRDLRLYIHDELLGESDGKRANECLAQTMAVMESPCPALPLPESWGMGTHLSLGVDGKIGPCWGTMRSWQPS
jgi:hypothetical protein